MVGNVLVVKVVVIGKAGLIVTMESLKLICSGKAKVRRVIGRTDPEAFKK